MEENKRLLHHYCFLVSKEAFVRSCIAETSKRLAVCMEHSKKSQALIANFCSSSSSATNASRDMIKSLLLSNVTNAALFNKRVSAAHNNWAIERSIGCDIEWQLYFDTLLVYKAIHGHCSVPIKNNATKNSRHYHLAKWVKQQRLNYVKERKRCTSSFTRKVETHDRALKHRLERGRCANPDKKEEKIRSAVVKLRWAKLNAVGFKWSVIASNDVQERRMGELEKYKRKYGNCNVPFRGGIL